MLYVEVFCAPTQLKKVILIHPTQAFSKKCCSVSLANCCLIPNSITKKFLLILLEIFRDCVGRYGEHYCKFSLQPNECKKYYCVSPNNCSHLTFLKKSCSLGLARWFATKLHNSRSFWWICMRLACLDMKNICRKFRCKQTSTQKVVALVFEWRIYGSIRTLCIWMFDAHMRHSAPKVLKVSNRSVRGLPK